MQTVFKRQPIHRPTSLVTPTALLTLLLLAPVLEETVFRAGLQERLIRAGWTGAASNVATAAAFGLAHLATRPASPVLSLATALPALAVGALYLRRRRLAPCVAAHAGLNAGWLALASSWNGVLR